MMQFAGDSDNPLHWRFPLGRLFRIRIFVHIFFIIGAAVVVAQSIIPPRDGYYKPSILETFGELGLLFFIVLVHEFGHCFGARATGGEAEEILLWPLGGLAMVSPPHTARAHFITTASGPLVNVIFCILSGALLIAYAGLGAIPWNPIYGLSRGFMAEDAIQGWVTVFFALNYVILLFNLLPIYPMDGGRMLHAILWPKHGFRDATLIATRVGLIGAVILGIAGILLGAWPMTMIAVFGGITCFYDRKMLRSGMYEEESEFGYDFSRGFHAFDDPPTQEKKPSLLERRRAAREEAARIRAQQEEEQHRIQVDRILDKVHREGMGALTAAERRVLAKETERQRASDE